MKNVGLSVFIYVQPEKALSRDDIDLDVRKSVCGIQKAYYIISNQTLIYYRCSVSSCRYHVELSWAWNQWQSTCLVFMRPPHSVLAPEREKERETVLMIKNNLLFPWEEKESGRKLFLGDDVTLNPKLVYIEDWRAEMRQWAGASPPVENQREQMPPRACGLTGTWPWQEH